MRRRVGAQVLQQATHQRPQLHQLLQQQGIRSRAAARGMQQGCRQLAKHCPGGALQRVAQRPLLPVAAAVPRLRLPLLLPVWQAGGQVEVADQSEAAAACICNQHKWVLPPGHQLTVQLASSLPPTWGAVPGRAAPTGSSRTPAPAPAGWVLLQRPHRRPHRCRPRLRRRMRPPWPPAGPVLHWPCRARQRTAQSTAP